LCIGEQKTLHPRSLELLPAAVRVTPGGGVFCFGARNCCRAEQQAHLLQRPAARLREAGEEEHPRESDDAGVEEEAAADGDGAGQRQE